MFKNLPDTLLIERSMMHRMETSGAILQYLPQFLQTLARTKESVPSLEGFEADLKRQEKVQRQEMAKSIEWITEKIDKLKMSPYAKHPLVEHTIERAERSKNSEDNLPPVILLNSIILRGANNSLHFLSSIFRVTPSDKVLDNIWLFLPHLQVII